MRFRNYTVNLTFAMADLIRLAA